MLAYRAHSPVTREAFLASIRAHREADRIVQGRYWENGRGCAVGCALESVRTLAGLVSIKHDRHAEIERYLGIPLILARLEDRIFERLLPAEARDWPLRFSEAIADGADLSGVWNRVAPRILREIALPAVDDSEGGVRAAITRVISGYETGWTQDSPRKAADAAFAAYADAVSCAAAAAVHAARAVVASTSAAAAAAHAADAVSGAAILAVAAFVGAAAYAAHDAEEEGDDDATAWRAIADITIEELRRA